MIRIDAAILALVAAAGLTACPQGDVGPGDATIPVAQPDASAASDPVEETPAQAERRPVVTVSESDPAHLVDSAGQALYVLEGNADGSRCDAACEDAWPPVLAEDAEPTADPAGLAPQLGSMHREDGSLHVTWQDQPLYRYAADSGVGATAGHGVDDQWGTWSLVSPEGSALPH